MFSNWPLRKQVLSSFIVMTLMVVFFVGLNLRNVYALMESLAGVRHTQEALNGVEKVVAKTTAADLSHRLYALTGNATLLESTSPSASASGLGQELDAVAAGFSGSAELTKTVESLRGLVARQKDLLRTLIDVRTAQGAPATLAQLDGEGKRVMEGIQQASSELLRKGHETLVAQHEAQSQQTRRFTLFFGGGSLVLLTLTALIVLGVGGSLKEKLGTAIAQVQGSSSELQSAASLQAAGSREQASATTEISTTVKELLSTARQIAASTQQLASVADETAGAAGTGNSAVLQAQEAIATVRRQVDAIVNHMLDLGKRSQEVGGILDIINELAEQTNLLAINATIESAGAGEHGKRFAVVAEEIRKLADRVGGATKDIRVLIDEIRAASNTTIMATEDGSKAVQSSAQQFNDVAGNFRHIAELVRTNLDVAREIEMSTQQQTTAVEQVNTTILEVAKTARQTETSSTQTLHTATRLIELSQQLSTLMESRPNP